MAQSGLLIDSPSEGVTVITLNRPDAHNALDRQLYFDLHSTVLELARGEETRAIVITGAGGKAFSAGYDVKELLTFETDEQLLDYYRRDQWMYKIASCRATVIAAVNGLAYGGGANLAFACDIRVGCANSRFKVPAVAYAGLNSTWSLPQIVGYGVAKDWLLTGRVVEADEAYQRGLLNYLVEPDAALDKAVEVAAGIAAHPPVGPRAVKQLIDENIGRRRADALRAETNQLIIEQPPKPVGQIFESFLNKSRQA